MVGNGPWKLFPKSKAIRVLIPGNSLAHEKTSAEVRFSLDKGGGLCYIWYGNEDLFHKAGSSDGWNPPDNTPTLVDYWKGSDFAVNAHEWPDTLALD